MKELKILSEKSDFYLSKNRQREILYFVKQYTEFKNTLRELDGIRTGTIKCENKQLTDEVFVNLIFKRSKLIDKIAIIEESAYETNDILWKFLIDSVVTDRTWDYYDLHFHIDCGRNTWYKLRREFIWRVSNRQ